MNIAIMLSGGVGSRMGGRIPKQYIEVNGKPVFCWAVEAFFKRADIDGIVMVVAPEWLDYVKEQLPSQGKRIIFTQPGETRQYSIYNGLKAAKQAGYEDEDIVIIHDAVRPFVKDATIDACIEGIREGYDAVMPAIKVKDTTYVTDDGVTISGLLDRNKLRAGQAPESFRLGRYLSLHDTMPKAELLKINGSTELAFKAGLRVKIVPGDEGNFKITTPEDLVRFKQLVRA